MQHGTARAHGIVTLLNMQFMVQESVQLADGIPVKHGGGGEDGCQNSQHLELLVNQAHGASHT